MQRDTVMPASEAERIIVDCDTITTSGVVGSGLRAARAVALEARFLESGMRRGLTPVHAAGPGDGADRRNFLEWRIDLRPASRLTLANRVRYDAGENILFFNFECLNLETDTEAEPTSWPWRPFWSAALQRSDTASA